MRPVRLSTLLPRLGIAAVAVVGVATVFATAGGLFAFGLWPDHSSPRDSRRIVLRAASAPPARDQERRSATRAPRAEAPAPGAVRSIDPRRGMEPPAVAATILGEPKPAPALLRPPPPPPPPAQPKAPRAPVGEAVSDTTSALARGLRNITRSVVQRLAPVLPAVATVVEQAGDGLGDIVDEAGRRLSALLGSPAR
jgi:hypothetical protein